MAKPSAVIKIQDTFNDRKSAADRYWNSFNLRSFYKSFRKPMVFPLNYVEDVNSVIRVQEIFKLRGFQFGNWVSTEDRFNYLAAMYICLWDLQRVLQFKSNNLGLNKELAISFGSRGVPNASAHFEPRNMVINIARYYKASKLKDKFPQLQPIHLTKEVLFITTGGIGAVAHEYGHFLDAAFGVYTEPVEGRPYLTGRGGSLSKDRIDYPPKFVIRNLVEDFFQELFWTKTRKKTGFSKRLESTKSDYLENRQEIFARVFEQYVSYKLQKIKIKNDFIVQQTKYDAKYYLTASELKKIIPALDKIVARMRYSS